LHRLSITLPARTYLAAVREINSRSVKEMLMRIYLKLRGYQEAQTMTEYAFILAAVAIVVWVTYQLMGQDVSVLVTRVDDLLTTS
jgi:Flp pilus assembly pilin Flp